MLKRVFLSRWSAIFTLLSWSPVQMPRRPGTNDTSDKCEPHPGSMSIGEQWATGVTPIICPRSSRYCEFGGE